MENVSHFFLFKGKLQTKSPSPPQMWPPPVTTIPHLMSIMPFLWNWGAYQNPPIVFSPLQSVQKMRGSSLFVEMTKFPATTNTEKSLSL